MTSSPPKINVLVTGVGSNIGQGIMKALRMSELPVKLIGADSEPLSAGLYRCERGYIVPPARSSHYIPTLSTICRKEKIDIVLVGSDPEPSVLARKKEKLELEGKTRVLVSPAPLIDTFQDKWKTHLFLKEKGFYCPESYLAETAKKNKMRLRFPMVVKPRLGAGSRDVHIVNTEEEMNFVLRRVKDPILQEYLKGNNEFTIGLFYDRDSILKGVIVMKREIFCGTTYRAIVDDYPGIKRQAERLGHAIGKEGAIGPINVQAKYIKNRLMTFEINPRFSGTTVFRAKFNFNEPEAAIRNFVLGQDIPQFKPKCGVVMRYWDEVYATLEDLKKVRHDGHIGKPDSEILNLL